jgi:hypothetical protein
MFELLIMLAICINGNQCYVAVQCKPRVRTYMKIFLPLLIITGNMITHLVFNPFCAAGEHILYIIVLC